MIICYNFKMINFEDFQKLDIRIGTIISAERVPRADKLLKLEVDLGTDKRQILAGIAEFIDDPNKLVGKQIPILTNLEPKKFRGYESQGMMLAVGTDNKPVLLHPAEIVPNGSKIR